MNPRRAQLGESLIGILTGLAISLFSAIAMLSAYRLMVGTSMPATRTAKREGQAAAALLTAQIELQQAGFGINSSDAGPSVHVHGADKKKIVWRFRATPAPTAEIMCAGLNIQAGATPAPNDGIYFLLPAACDDADDSTTFDSRLLATASVMFEPSATDESRSYDLSRARFEVDPSPNCGPYGVPGSRPGSQLVQLKDAVNGTVIFSHCLSNL